MPIRRRAFRRRMMRRRRPFRKGGILGREKKFNKKYSRTLICKTPGGFPDHYFAKIMCNTVGTSGSFAALANVATVIKLNSALTPFGGSTVASGLSFLLGSKNDAGTSTAPYSNYIVHACSLEIDPIVTNPTANSANLPLIVVAALAKGDTTFSGQLNTLLEMPYSKYRTLSASSNQPFNVSNKLKMHFPIRAIAGIPKKQSLRGIEQLQGDYTNDPTDAYNAVLVLGTGTSNFDAGLVISYRVKATYYCEFYNRNSLKQSAPV